MALTVVGNSNELFISVIGAGGSSGAIFNFSLGTESELVDVVESAVDDYMNINNFIKMHEQTKQSYIVNNSKFFEIEEDYEKEIKNVYDWIDKQVRIHFKARKL
ncbi:hypothetical protein CLORY_09830 [Clostridium oryzae]|uniref:Uncharacterized protein n=1 Tax=Clostridium oryzae TaxID=1450648 RepID=A0A1V4IV65_9CLOT|nr:hypothetical protein CLORY_09830 [Clostridium oryzae]